MTIDAELRQRAETLAAQMRQWRLPTSRVEAVRAAARSVAEAMAAGDDKGLLVALDDVEMAGPVRGLAPEEDPDVTLPPDIPIIIDAQLERDRGGR